MKRFFTLHYFYSILALLVFTSVIPSFAQTTKEEITEGKEYWFGIPHCKKEAGEAIRGDFPMAVWISSKVQTVATVEDAETGSKRNYTIYPNRITQVPMGDNVMNTESEVPRNFGIHVTSNDPISVAVYLSYRWSGEAYRVIPVEWLGKKYVTLNLYQDKTDEYKPAQILVIATEDNTLLKYRPTAKTEKCDKGKTRNVTLQRGQTFLIEAMIDPGLNQDNQTDLTGTYLEANKPFGVISGHTKGAFPRYQSHMLHRPGNFMRNMMVDMLWPIELLGKEYVSAPIKYANRPRGQIQDDKGDMIRFVAYEDGTIISKMTKDGQSLQKISRTLKKSEWHEITNMEEAAYYQSNKPVLVGQYGKTWWSYAVTPKANDKGEDPQNPSRNGQGMLVVLAPFEHWCSYATFKAPEQIDNFVYVTFEADMINKLKFDGVPFTQRFGSAITYINGTKYAYITQQISAGDHWIEGLKLDDGKNYAKFAGYCYGNWDQCKDGFAYGYPIGINYSTPCEDSLVMDHTIFCGDITGTAEVLPSDAECAEILAIRLDHANSINYSTIEYENVSDGEKFKKATFTIKVDDKSKYGKAIFWVQSKSGLVLRDSAEYFPEEISVTPNKINFGLLKVGENPCQTFTVKNVGKAKVVVSDIRIDPGTYAAKFTLNTAGIVPFTLEVGESKEITACAVADELIESIEIKATVTAALTCYEKVIDTLVYNMSDPIVWIGDAEWVNVPINVEKPKKVTIKNRGEVEVVLTSMSWPDKLHFPRVEGLNFPLKLQGGESMEFTTFYIPNEINVQHTTRALFEGNTDKDKLYSDWTGNGIDAGPTIDGYNWNERRVIDNYAGVTEYPYVTKMGNVGNTDLIFKDLYVDDPEGVFRVEKNNALGVLKQDTEYPVPVFFAPKAEKVYRVPIHLKTEFDNKHKDVFAYLEGTGTLPHINVADVEFSEILINTTETKTSKTANITNLYPMELTIFNLKIEDDASNAFQIDQTWLAANPYPIKIPVDGSIDVPIIFTAKHSGDHTAKLVAENDAPAVNDPNAFNEKPIGDLIGRGYEVGVNTTDYNFPQIFITTRKDGGVVYLNNNGSKDITLKNDISADFECDNEYIKVKTWWIEDENGQTIATQPGSGSIIPAHGRVAVETYFYPTKVGSYTAKVHYITEDQADNAVNSVSNITAPSMVLKTVASIPAGKYVSDPDKTVWVEYNMQKHAEEAKALADAGIKEFKALIHFKSESSNLFQDVAPERDPSTKEIKISTEGTMTQGWTINYATIENNRTLMVKFTSPGTPLAMNGEISTLFKVAFHTYLSDLDIIPLPCEFIPTDGSEGYVLVDEIPGDIKIQPVCVNEMRLIKLIDNMTSIIENTPNPVNDKTTIQYQVGEDGHVTFDVYDMMGNKVATLFSQNHKKGIYKYELDVNDFNMPAGMYTCKIQSGSQSDTKQIIVTK